MPRLVTRAGLQVDEKKLTMSHNDLLDILKTKLDDEFPDTPFQKIGERVAGEEVYNKLQTKIKGNTISVTYYMGRPIGERDFVEIWYVECKGIVNDEENIRTMRESGLHNMQTKAFEKLVEIIWKLGNEHVDNMYHILLRAQHIIGIHLKLRFKIEEQNEEPFYFLENVVGGKNVRITCSSNPLTLEVKCGSKTFHVYDVEHPSSYKGLFFGIMEMVDEPLAQVQEYLWKLYDDTRNAYTFDVKYDGQQFYLHEFRGYGSNEKKIMIKRLDSTYLKIVFGSDEQLIESRYDVAMSSTQLQTFKDFIDGIRHHETDEQYFNTAYSDLYKDNTSDSSNRSGSSSESYEEDTSD